MYIVQLKLLASLNKNKCCGVFFVVHYELLIFIITKTSLSFEQVIHRLLSS